MVGASGLGLAFAGPGRLRRPEPGMTEDDLREVHRYNMATLLFADPANADELALEMQVRNAANIRIRSHTSAVTSILLEALPAIRARLGAIWGGRDPFLPARAEREALLRRFDPDTPIHIVEGAGHWVPSRGRRDSTAASSTSSSEEAPDRRGRLPRPEAQDSRTGRGRGPPGAAGIVPAPSPGPSKLATSGSESILGTENRLRPRFPSRDPPGGPGHLPRNPGRPARDDRADAPTSGGRSTRRTARSPSACSPGR